MSFLKFLLRIILFLLLIIVYLASSFLILVFTGFNFKRARLQLIHLVSKICSLGLVIFGVEVTVHGRLPDKDKNYLIVSNHLSYIDILVISSLFPTCFVTSQEMKETPFLGQLCLLGGCLFVERRSKKRIGSEVAELANALKGGLNVAIFPEATSTNGEAVIRFKRPLFQSAIVANSEILPLCLNYKSLDGEKITLKNRDIMFWHGNMPFGGHALKLLRHKKIIVEINILESFHSGIFPGKNELSHHTFELIDACYEKVIN